jgi:DtxR family Mn-dependent transcriptional regulator
MGLNKGALIEVKGKAPMGDPIEVKVRGYSLSLRQDEAAEIKVEEV